MAKGFAGLVAATVAALALAATAGATAPAKSPAPAGDTTIKGSCQFDVDVHFTKQNESAIAFADGTVLVTGQFMATLTNDQTKTSISLNIPGPGRITFNDDGSITQQIVGPWLIFAPGFMTYATGRGVVQIDAAGNLTWVQQGGTQTDLCAALG